MHFVSPFSHFARGYHPRTLETNFDVYVWPRFSFTEPLWIFRIKTPFHYTADFNYGYKTKFENLERLYIGIGRKILGAHPTTANLAIMVRIGWLPLEYKYALNAIMWTLRIINNTAGPTLEAFYNSINTDPHLLKLTATIQPAIDFLTHLNKYSDHDLLQVHLKQAKSAIRTAMFNELTDIWKHEPSCKQLHNIHSDWRPRSYCRRSVSRVTISCYHTLACGAGYLRSWSHRIKLSPSPNCRHGCNVSETAEHILLDCPFYTSARNSVCKLCVSHGLDISQNTFLTESILQFRVEKLLRQFLVHS